MSTTTLKNDYKERIVPALVKQFNYTSVMQVPTLKKIVINQGLGEATQDKKIIETAIRELTDITGQKAVATVAQGYLELQASQEDAGGRDGDSASRQDV